MTDTNYEDTVPFLVVRNHEEQYSVWPVGRELPLGWVDCGFNGDKQSCLKHIESVWTDMRPLSLRKQMDSLAKTPATQSPAAPEPSAPDLVERLCTGSHKVRAVVRPENSDTAFKDAIDRGFVQIEFTETQGGTVLGFAVDVEQSDLSQIGDNKRKGQAVIVGMLTLNFQKVRCVATIDLKNLTGEGKLELVH
jgi:uncharacterized protein YbdZ (MbtH family)